MLTFNHTCIGYSHLQSGKPCQDASYSETSNRMSIAIVSDGHGEAIHSRSDVGAQFAIFAAQGVIETHPLSDWENPDERQALFNEIVDTWTSLTIDHYYDNLTEQAIAQLPLFPDVEQSIRNITTLYGCTLMAACVHAEGWFAFQIGDGKCVTINRVSHEASEKDNSTQSYTTLHNSTQSLTSEPVPDDDRCFLNMTTSLCDLNAATEFRFCGGNKDTIPVAIFLGSDGIDNSWGSTELLHDFYLEVFKHCYSREIILQELQEVLPQLSEKSSHDDMSIAALVQEDALSESITAIYQHQIAECERIKKRQETRLIGCQEAIALKQAELAERPDDEFLQRDLSNLQNQVSQLNQQLSRTIHRLIRLQQQSSKDNIKTCSRIDD